MSSGSKVARGKSARAGLTFPVSRFQRHLRNGNYANKIGTTGSVYLTGVIEYLVAEILELSGAAAKDHRRVRIIPRHVMMAIKNDYELNDFLKDAWFAESGVMPNLHPTLQNRSKPKKVGQNDNTADIGDGDGEIDDDNDIDDGDEEDDDENEGDGDDSDENDGDGDYSEEDGEDIADASVVAGSQNF